MPQERTVHRHLYLVWHRMKQRCEDPRISSYSNYGARGIRVCGRWQIFENFKRDMVPNYRRGLWLDRIDSNGNYEPSNCRWASVKYQQNNRTNNHIITYGGVTMNLGQWASKLGLKSSTLRMRINNYNWPLEKALREVTNEK